MRFVQTTAYTTRVKCELSTSLRSVRANDLTLRLLTHLQPDPPWVSYPRNTPIVLVNLIMTDLLRDTVPG